MFSLKLSDQSQHVSLQLPASVDDLRCMANVFAENQEHRLVLHGKPITDSFDVKTLKQGETVFVVKASAEKASVYKIQFNGEWRRFRAASSLSFAEFVTHLQRDVSSKIHPELWFTYIDCDGDEITIGSEIEWVEAKREFTDRAIKINVKEGKNQGKYFKDCTVQVVGVRRGDSGDVQAPVEPRAINATLALVQSLFPQNKILPFNVPEFLKPAVKVLAQGAADAQLDIDMARLQAVLQQRVLTLFETRDFAAAKTLLAAMIDAAGADNGFNTPWCWYNLACAHSLEGDINDALVSLQAAVDSGFGKLELLVSDQDFDAIKSNHPRRFQQIVNCLVDKVAAAAAPAPPAKN